MPKRKAASGSENPNHEICELLTGNDLIYTKLIVAPKLNL